MRRIFTYILIAFSLLLLNVDNVYAANVNISTNSLNTYEIKRLANDDVEGSSGGERTVTHENDTFNTNCRDFAKTLRLGGEILLAVKIILPIIIIIKASLNMFSTITEGNQDEIKKKLMKLFYSLVAAILIFFIPTVTNVLVKIATDVKGTNYKTSDSEICRKCIFEPNSEICEINAK